MSIFYLILLAIIQGVTEFLPVSSSAHLILPEKLGWGSQGAMIDVMAHFGSLFAVLIYFRQDVASMLRGLGDLMGRRLNKDSALALNLIFRKAWIIAVASIVFGIVLWWADVKFAREKTTENLTWKGAFTMGLAQAIAFIPGTSRSGITMTAARMMNFTRVEAARFSMLMSLPLIGAGGIYSLLKLSRQEAGTGATLTEGIIVAFLSFLAAYVAITFFMKLVSRIGMFPFMVYRVLLGILILGFLVF